MTNNSKTDTHMNDLRSHMRSHSKFRQQQNDNKDLLITQPKVEKPAVKRPSLRYRRDAIMSRTRLCLNTSKHRVSPL